MAGNHSEKPSLRVAATMHRGNNPGQQDAMWLAGESLQHDDLPPQRFDCDDGLFAVADGLANSPTPERASRLAVEALAKSLRNHPERTGYDGLPGTRHVRAAQTALCDALASHRLPPGSSTTLVVAYVQDGRVVVLNSGDSRAYLIRADGGVKQVSRDHTELQKLIDSGEAEAGVEYASMYYVLSDCLVADPEGYDFAVHREVIEWHPGDRLILCSDGVHDTLDEVEWLAAMVAEPDPVKMVEGTRQAVLARGAPDNFSIIALVCPVQP